MDKDTLLDWYRQMVLIRRFEERSDELYQLEGKIKGFLHLYIGQEAVAVGSIGARKEGDHIITAYRDHGHALAVGIPATQVMAELMGKATGVVGGRGGSMHMASKEKTFWGGYGIVGAHISLGVGLALAEKYKGSDAVCLCYFGDGATNEGAFHESLNMASIWKLPIIYLCENNQYAMSMSVERAFNIERISQRGCAYGIPGVTVDGNDVAAVYEAVKEAKARAQAGEGPTLIECLTYRWRGHSKSDRQAYRTREEVREWQDRDPIPRFASWLSLTDEQVGALWKEAEGLIETAVSFAQASPEPDLSTILEGVYA